MNNERVAKELLKLAKELSGSSEGLSRGAAGVSGDNVMDALRLFSMVVGHAEQMTYGHNISYETVPDIVPDQRAAKEFINSMKKASGAVKAATNVYDVAVKKFGLKLAEWKKAEKEKGDEWSRNNL